MILFKKYSYFAVLIVFLVTTTCKKDSEKAENMKISEETVQEETPFFKLSLAQWSLHREVEKGELDPFDFPKVAKELGFEAVEWVDQLFVKQIDSMGFDAVIERWKQESEKHGVKNVLIMVDEAGDLSHSNKEKRDEAVELHKKYVDAAAYLGCESIRVNTFGTYDPEEWIETTYDGLKRLSEYAATKNISVLPENHGWFSSDPRLLIPVLEKINMDNCGTLADFGNWCIKRVTNEEWSACAEEYPDKYEGIERLMPAAKAVSAKSYDFDADGNETTIDYQRMLQIVKDAGYTGYIGVEYEGNRLSEEEGIIATRDLLINASKKLN